VLAKDRILQFDLVDGVLTEAKSSPTVTRLSAGPRHITWHPMCDTLYTINELEGSVDVYCRQMGDGRLSLIETHRLMPNGFRGNARAADIHVTADGRFLFASVRATNTITTFQTDRDSGRLTFVASISVGGSPRAFGLSPDGEYLLSCSQELNVVEVYRIESAGRLALLDRVGTGRNPSWVEIISLSREPSAQVPTNQTEN
jgi:6-phosphogluconolactonase